MTRETHRADDPQVTSASGPAFGEGPVDDARLAELAEEEARARTAERGTGRAADGGARGGLVLRRTSSEPVARRGDVPAATDPRFDAGRLSIVGSAEERDRNLGLFREPLGGVDAAAPPPPPQQGAGAGETPAPPIRRQGAGRPGAGGDPYE